MRVILIFFLIVHTSTMLSANTLVVSAAGPFHTIKEAIEMAGPGDTVLIKGGVYREGNLLIEKSIVLIGQGSPVLDGQFRYEILTIRANNVTVSGLTFIDTGWGSLNDIAAIGVSDAKNIRIAGNILKNTFFGIHFSNSRDSWIEGNQLESHATEEQEIGNGVHLWKCDNITIHNNTIKGHRDGIYFEFATHCLITGNRSEQNLRYGLHFMFSHNDEYRDNFFVNNSAGVSVMYTKGVKMINNTFEHNWGSASYGLLLKEISDSFVTGNKFLENSIGIYMEGSSRIMLTENIFSRNGYAVKLQASCDGNVFTRNNFSSNTFDIATNGILVLNTVNGNYWDRYEGYDLNKDNIGDIPYRPVSMYSMVVERIPTAVLLWRSFLVFLMDRAEKAIPVLTPENLKDESPSIKPYDII